LILLLKREEEGRVRNCKLFFEIGIHIQRKGIQLIDFLKVSRERERDQEREKEIRKKEIKRKGGTAEIKNQIKPNSKQYYKKDLRNNPFIPSGIHSLTKQLPLILMHANSL